MCARDAQCYFRQLIAGVDYLHRVGVAHRDLKPENLLLTTQGNVSCPFSLPSLRRAPNYLRTCVFAAGPLKIADFGMATVFRHQGVKRQSSTRCGTLPYVAPEVLLDSYDPEKADLWSCGVILVALLSGELPWDEPTLGCPQFADWREKTNLDQSPWAKIENVALCTLFLPRSFQLTL